MNYYSIAKYSISLRQVLDPFAKFFILKYVYIHLYKTFHTHCSRLEICTVVDIIKVLSDLWNSCAYICTFSTIAILVQQVFSINAVSCTVSLNDHENTALRWKDICNSTEHSFVTMTSNGHWIYSCFCAFVDRRLTKNIIEDSMLLHKSTFRLYNVI